MQNAPVGMYVCSHFQAVCLHGRRYILKDKTSKQPAGVHRQDGGRGPRAEGGDSRESRVDRRGEIGEQRQQQGQRRQKKMRGNEPPTTREPNTNP